MTTVAPPITVRLPHELEKAIRADLQRPHSFAAERVGFVEAGVGAATEGTSLILLRHYRPVEDAHYIDDPASGARINGTAIREAMQQVLESRCGVFHVHWHPGRGAPRLSSMDERELPRLVQSLRSIGPDRPHGVLLLSDDSWAAWVWLPGAESAARPTRLTSVGAPLRIVVPGEGPGTVAAERFSRQSFLGPVGQPAIERAIVGIVGLGGGGSHVVQQFAHLGVGHPRGFDADSVSDSNLNRLVGAQDCDVARHTSKAEVARRVTAGVAPYAETVFIPARWQERTEVLRGCDLVVGCVDSFAERDQLERFCRRYLIPYLDIGMDVHRVAPEPPRMAGQVILSMPGRPCMWCWGFLTEERLAQEAQNYGAAGNRPQVVWPNGVLASTAVGVAVDLLTGWSGATGCDVYLSYDGNAHTLTPHIRLQYHPDNLCEHHPIGLAGDPVFTSLGPSAGATLNHFVTGNRPARQLQQGVIDGEEAQ